MMSFNKDLFISYAHIDNYPITPEQKGWVSRFHESLEAMLSMRLGQTAKIWRDDKLQGNDVFADEIVTQFSHTGVLVSILTPRYLNSAWCTREVREFCERAGQNGEMFAQNYRRKVGKLAHEISQLLKRLALASDTRAIDKASDAPTATKATIYLAE
jgi:hypothetical protein